MPGASVDVVISNCVINLSADKDAVLREAFRVLRPGGRFVMMEHTEPSHPVTRFLDRPELQQALKSAGYYSGTCDGYYGDATVKAVKNYQRAKGLVQDGKAGPATQRYLYEGDFPDQA